MAKQAAAIISQKIKAEKRYKLTGCDLSFCMFHRSLRQTNTIQGSLQSDLF